MAYQVRWQLVGRSGQPLDNGCLGDGIGGYRDAVAAVVEFLRPYPEVSHCSTESYWLARRSCEADLAVWVWVELHENDGGTRAGNEWMFSRQAADQIAKFVTD
jgi:hypothetical protein